MIGFKLQFKRNFMPSEEAAGCLTLIPIGDVDLENISVSVSSSDDDTNSKSEDDSPRSKLEVIASRLPPPRISENFMAPVNDVSFSSKSFGFLKISFI